ncbi:MAG: arginase family protein [Nanopusillaceae archaeon]
MFAHAEGNFEKSKWIIVGIPSEIGSLSPIKDYLKAPEAIREASYRIFSTIFGDINTKEIFDYGDLNLEDIKNLEEIYEKIYQELNKIYSKEKKYVFLGGDHSITYPILKLIKENWDDFYLLFFDAHPDIHPDPYVNYQSFIYYLIKEEYIKPDNIIMLGISNLSFEEKEILKNWKIKYYTPFELWDNISKVVEEISEILKNKKIYISIDLDVFDCGCGHWVEPFGIRPYHYFKILKNINSDILGLDIVELYSNEFCENLSAKIILETISIVNNKINL